MVHEWEYNSAVRDLQQKNKVIEQQRKIIEFLKSALRKVAGEVNENDPMLASFILDDIKDSESLP